MRARSEIHQQSEIFDPECVQPNRIIDELFEEHDDEAKQRERFGQSLVGKPFMELRTWLREWKQDDIKTSRNNPNSGLCL